MQVAHLTSSPLENDVFVQEQLLRSIRDDHAREVQAWKDRLQRDLQAQDQVCRV
jgi:hypothetical protein